MKAKAPQQQVQDDESDTEKGTTPRPMSRSERVIKADEEQALLLVPALAVRAYHLPGNSWCSDWRQYLINNHPLFGICCHDKHHPIRWPMRILILIGSVLVGLTLSNLFFLWSIENGEYDKPLVSISIASNSTIIKAISSGDDTADWEVTTGMLLLWTVGGAIHSLFDLLIWYIASCACCPLLFRKARSLQAFTFYLVIFFIVGVIAVASLVVYVRASTPDEQDETAIEKRDFEFLLGYSIELVLVFVIWYPLVGTIFFSGVLGCGRLPILGGRPRDMKLEDGRLQEGELDE
jgi:hypothetical protein